MKYILLSVVALLSFLPLMPVTERGSHHVTIATTIGATAITAGISRSPLWSAIAAVASYYLTSSYLNKFTPIARFKQALHLATVIGKNPFATNSYDREEIFINDLQDYFTAKGWLIDAHEEMEKLTNLGYKALELIDLAKEESENDFYLLQECSILQKKIRAFLINIATALRRIKNHTDFTAQRAAYNQLLLEKERLAIEREKAHAYYIQARAQQEQAAAQQAHADAAWYSVRRCTC